jgi:hypothetical protein
MNTMPTNEKADNIDGLLSRYFQAEMPEPWPECQVWSRLEKPGVRSWFRSTGRLALAASVLLFFLGYLTLAGIFPRTSTSTQTLDHSQDIGSKINKEHKVRK